MTQRHVRTPVGFLEDWYMSSLVSKPVQVDVSRFQPHATMLFELALFIANALSVVALAPIDILGKSYGAPGDASFDYVIVGGGTAGLAVAARLTQSSAHSVAVIEAGGSYELDNGNLSVIPGDCTYYAGTDPKDTRPAVDWSFNTVPQEVLFLIV